MYLVARDHVADRAERLHVPRARDVRRRRIDIGNADAVDEHIGRENFIRRTKARLPGERDIFVRIVARHEARRRGALRLPREDRSRGAEVRGVAVAGHADAADELSIFVKRHAARRVIERTQRHAVGPRAGRLKWIRQRERIEVRRDLFEAIDVGVKKV